MLGTASDVYNSVGPKHPCDRLTQSCCWMQAGVAKGSKKCSGGGNVPGHGGEGEWQWSCTEAGGPGENAVV